MSGNQVRSWFTINNAAVYSRDSVEKVSGDYSYKISKTNPTEKRDAFFYNSLPLELVKGKDIILKGKIKTDIKEKAEAGLFLLAYDKMGKPIQYDDMAGKRINHTSSWQEVSISAKIDSNATNISIGGTCYGGAMTAWFDDFELFIDGQKYITPVPRTAPLTKNELAVLKKYCYPLHSFDPDFKNDADLSILKKLTKDAKIVALGESSHGSSEIFKMKHRIIKYLAQHDKVNLLAFEAAMPESNQLNQAILKQQFEKVNIHEQLHLFPWHTSEIRNLFNWMQNYNQGKPKIEFAGFDMQHYNGAITELKQAFAADSAIQKDLNTFEQLLFSIQAEYVKKNGVMALTPEQTQDTQRHIKRIQTASQESNVNKTTKEWVMQNTKIITQYLDKSDETRERYMAENLLWLSNQNPDSKIIAWAHNSHVAKTYKKIGQYMHYKRTGAYMADAIQKKYVAIGFAFYDGSFTNTGPKGITSYPAQTSFTGTYEHFLNQINEPIFILDLKKIKADKPVELNWLLSTLPFRVVGAGTLRYEFDDQNIANDFDYLIFIKTSTGSHFLN
jgi:erythromycin esterase